jgi:hypothetical protein
VLLHSRALSTGVHYHWPLGTVFLRFNARPASVCLSVCLFVCLFVCPRPATLYDSLLILFVTTTCFSRTYCGSKPTTASDFHVPIIQELLGSLPYIFGDQQPCSRIDRAGIRKRHRFPFGAARKRGSQGKDDCAACCESMQGHRSVR